jgi:hypothetical protein
MRLWIFLFRHGHAASYSDTEVCFKFVPTSPMSIFYSHSFSIIIVIRPVYALLTSEIRKRHQEDLCLENDRH